MTTDRPLLGASISGFSAWQFALMLREPLPRRVAELRSARVHPDYVRELRAAYAQLVEASGQWQEPRISADRARRSRALGLRVATPYQIELCVVKNVVVPEAMQAMSIADSDAQALAMQAFAIAPLPQGGWSEMSQGDLAKQFEIEHQRREEALQTFKKAVLERQADAYLKGADIAIDRESRRAYNIRSIVLLLIVLAVVLCLWSRSSRASARKTSGPTSHQSRPSRERSSAIGSGNAGGPPPPPGISLLRHAFVINSQLMDRPLGIGPISSVEGPFRANSSVSYSLRGGP